MRALTRVLTLLVVVLTVCGAGPARAFATTKAAPSTASKTKSRPKPKPAEQPAKPHVTARVHTRPTPIPHKYARPGAVNTIFTNPPHQARAPQAPKPPRVHRPARERVGADAVGHAKHPAVARSVAPAAAQAAVAGSTGLSQSIAFINNGVATVVGADFQPHDFGVSYEQEIHQDGTGDGIYLFVIWDFNNFPIQARGPNCWQYKDSGVEQPQGVVCDQFDANTGVVYSNALEVHGGNASDTIEGRLPNGSGPNHALIPDNRFAVAAVGEGGDDTLVAGFGLNQYWGGPGTDHIDYTDWSSSAVSFNDAPDDSGGNVHSDIEVFDGSPGTDTVFPGSTPLTVNGNGGYNTVDFSQSGMCGIYESLAGNAGTAGDALNGVQHLKGTACTDTLDGSPAGGENLEGLGGGDTMWGAGGQGDELHGGNGGDWFVASENASGERFFEGGGGATISYQRFNGVRVGFDQLPLGEVAPNGIAALSGSPGNDVFIPTPGRNDDFDGDGGYDTVQYDEFNGVRVSTEVGRGADSWSGISAIVGSPGNDTLVVDGGNINLAGAGGIDDVTFASAGAGVTATLGGTYLVPGEAQGTLAADIENMDGSDQSDTLTGSDAANTIHGGDGVDYIYGNGGPDQLFGDDGGDWIYGGAGNDQLWGDGPGNHGADHLFGQGDDDTLYADATAGDELSGGSSFSWDTIDYSATNDDLTINVGGQAWHNNAPGIRDTLDLTQGALRVVGGGGSDTFVKDAAVAGAVRYFFEGGPGSDTFIDRGNTVTAPDSYEGDGGTDTLQYDTSVNVLAGLDGGAIGPRFAAGGPAEGDDIHPDIENLTGGSGNDQLYGNNLDNVIIGGAGDDHIYGELGADQLSGNDGNDFIYGNYCPLATEARGIGYCDNYQLFDGDGGDHIFGGWGDDQLYGQGGKDYLFGDLGNDYLNGGTADGAIDVLDARDGIPTYNGYIDDHLFVDTVVCGSSGGNTNQDEAVGDAGYDNLYFCDPTPVDKLLGLIEVGPGIPGLSFAPLPAPPGDPAHSAIEILAVGAFDQIFVRDGTWEDQLIHYLQRALGSRIGEGLKEYLGDNLIVGEFEEAGKAVLRYISTDGILRALNPCIHPDGEQWVVDCPVPNNLDFISNGSQMLKEPGDPVQAPDHLQNDQYKANGADHIKINGPMPRATFDLGNDDDLVTDAGMGSQTFNGGGGNNTVQYQRPAGTTVRMIVPAPGATSTGSGAPGENDQLNSFQTFVGGDQDDTFVAPPAATATQYSFDGAGGNNTLSYANRATPVSVTLPDDSTGTQQTRSDNTDGYTLTRIQNVIGGNGNDTLTGGTGPNDIMGGAGADIMDGKGGTNTLDYSDHSTGVTLTLPEPSTQLTTLPGADGDQVANFANAQGGTGDDTLTGNSQVNIIRGGDGRDTLNGGDDAPGIARKGDTLDGQIGDDIIDYSARTAPLTISLDGVANDGETGENDNVVPSAGKDVVKGGHGADVLRGGAVPATFQGNDGNDQFWNGTGSEEFVGGNDTDSAHYELSTGTVVVSLDDVANDGPIGQNDNIHSDVEEVDGGSAADLLIANPQKAATLRGNGGNDIIKGSLMSDTLDGGADTNTLVYDDTTDAPANQRTVGVTVTLPERGAANAKAVTVRAGEIDTLNDFTNIVGSSQGDVIHGNSEANNIQGGPGIDTLYGGDGNDVMSGGPGNDTLYGEKGDEMFNADADPGADTYSGGLGNNTISYANSLAKVTVTLDGVANDGQDGEGDNVGTDVQNVIGSRFNDRIEGANSGGNVLIGGAGDDTIIAHGASSTTPGDSLFGDSPFDGRVSGNDVLTGGPGVDTFYGGPGNDLFKSADRHAENIFCGSATDYDVLIPDKFSDGNDDVPQADCNAERHGQGATWWVPGWSDCATGPTTADPNALQSCVHQVAGTPSYGGDATSSTATRIDTVYRNGNNIVYRAKSCFIFSCGWSSTTLPALATSVLPVGAPSISARNANTLDVIAYGQHQPAALPTPHVYWMCISTAIPSTCTGGSGLGWTDITGSLGTLGATGSDGPEVARLTDNSFVVFATNWVNGCGIKYKVWNSGTWRDWSCVMNASVAPSDRTGDKIVFGSNFGAVSKAENDVMVVGVDQYGQLVQSEMGFDGTGYGILAATAGTWTALGSVCNNPTHPYAVFTGGPILGGCPYAGKPAISHTPGTSNYDIVLDDSDRFSLWWKPIRNGTPQAGRMLLGNTQMFGTPAIASYGNDPNNTQLYVSTASVSNQLWEGTYNQVDPPMNSVPPSISGTPLYGQTLTASPGTWNDPNGTKDPTYTWFRLPSGGSLQGITDPGGALHTGPTYTVTAADANMNIVVLVGVSNGVTVGSALAMSAVVQPTPPTNSAPPTIGGTPARGQIFSVTSNGTWGGTPAPTFSYQWQVCAADGTKCSTLSTASTYTAGPAALGGAIRVTVTGTNPFASLSVSSALSGVVPTETPTLTKAPTVSTSAGTLNTNSLLVTDTGSWSINTIPQQVAYQWMDCPASGGTCTNVKQGGQTNQYVPTASDVGYRLQAKVTVTFFEGPDRIAIAEAPALSAPTAVVVAG